MLSKLIEIGNSELQMDSNKFYGEKRLDHGKTFFSQQNIERETSPTYVRFGNGNVEGINNLYSFVNVLTELFSGQEQINVCDFGCGMHYFIHDLRIRFGWQGIGFDSDKQAIEIAKRRYPESSTSYVHLNLLKNQLPLADNSQDVVFSNAVIQHFSNEEFLFALSEMSRVLKPGGVLLLIFKRNIPDWQSFSAEYDLRVDIIDAADGIVKIEDISMRKKLAQAVDTSEKFMRLYHCFDIEKIIGWAKNESLSVLEIPWSDNNKKIDGIFTYNKGNKVPNAAIYLKKFT